MLRGNGPNSCELITLNSDEDEPQVASAERSKRLLHEGSILPISTEPPENRVVNANSRKRRHTARKSTTSFRRQTVSATTEVIDLSDDDNPPKREENSTIPHLHDGFEQFMNQAFIALKPRVDAIRHVENELTTSFRAMNILPQQIESLYSFLLQQTLSLSMDSDKVFLYVEEVKEKFRRLSDECKSNGSPSAKRIKLIDESTTNGKSNDVTKEEVKTPRTIKPIRVEKEETPEPKKTNNDVPRPRIISNPQSKVEVDLEDEEVLIVAKKKSTTKNGVPGPSKKVPPPNRKTNLHLKKLKNALDECGKEIRRLEAAEVDTHDDESTYVLLCRYKNRFMTIYNKIIELEDGLPKWKSQVVSLQTLGSRQTKKFKTQISRHPEINEKIAVFINKGIKKSLNSSFFPDFHDILGIYNEVNKSSRLGMNKDEIYEEASDAFQIIGRKLQSRRKYDVYASMESYLEENEPEPELTDDVKKKLTENQAIAEKSLDKVIQDFTLRQVSSKSLNGASEDAPPKEEQEDEDDGDSVSSVEVDGTEVDEEDLPSSDDEDSD